uniref:Uncharacterized protein n=1 Tax=Xiphophorus maculatus TaxID=8083 RepID=A0A3B5QDX3_XIPMA
LSSSQEDDTSHETSGKREYHQRRHLMTFSLQDGTVQGVEEAQARLSFLADNNKLWSQKMLLDIGSNSLRPPGIIPRAVNGPRPALWTPLM